MTSIGEALNTAYNKSPRGKQLLQMHQRIHDYAHEIIKPANLWTPADYIDFLAIQITPTTKNETVRAKKSIFLDKLKGIVLTVEIMKNVTVLIKNTISNLVLKF